MRSRAAWPGLQLLAILLGLYLIWPAATPVHVEGFTGQIQSLAHVLSDQGSVATHDLARPLISQFIFYSRPGVVDILAVANRLFGERGDLWFQVLTMCSLAALLLSSAAVAKRLADVPFALSLLACIAVPGMVELGFFFNDNLVSAAFAAMAFAAVTLSSATLAAVLAGLLFGMAVLCRIDGALAGPFLLLAFLMRQERAVPTVLRLVLMGLAALAVHVVAYQVNGITLLDGLRISGLFTNLHAERNSSLPGIKPLALFFGPIGMVLVALGIHASKNLLPNGIGRWLWISILYVYPLIVIAYVLRTATEVRYFLPLLAPVVAVFSGLGLKTLLTWIRGPQIAYRRAGLLIAAVLLILSTVPPMFGLMRDGPRLVVGRLWSPVIWHRWQDAMRFSLNGTDRVVTAISREPAAVLVTTSNNDEFFFRLRLFEAGYREAPVESSCRPLSRYVLGVRQVWHIRVHPEYQRPPFEPKLSVALLLSGVDRCEKVKGISPLWISSFGSQRLENVENGFKDFDFDTIQNRPLWVLLGEKVEKGKNPKLSFEILSAKEFPVEYLKILIRQAIKIVNQEAQVRKTSPDLMLNFYEAAFAIH